MRFQAARSNETRVIPLLAAGCLGLSMLAGCTKPEVPVAAPPPPNPFASMRASALCQVTPVAIAPTGAGSAKMAVRSDDGACAIKVAQPDATAYASFVLAGLPDHGKAFIYNYFNATYITYTATTAYAGPDHFSVNLIPGNGRPRVNLVVDVTVQPGVGVTPPPVATPAPVPAPTPPKTTAKRHTSTRHSTKKTRSGSN